MRLEWIQWLAFQMRIAKYQFHTVEVFLRPSDGAEIRPTSFKRESTTPNHPIIVSIMFEVNWVISCSNNCWKVQLSAISEFELLGDHRLKLRYLCEFVQHVYTPNLELIVLSNFQITIANQNFTVILSFVHTEWPKLIKHYLKSINVCLLSQYEYTQIEVNRVDRDLDSDQTRLTSAFLHQFSEGTNRGPRLIPHGPKSSSLQRLSFHVYTQNLTFSR